MSDEWKVVIADWQGESVFSGKNEAGGEVQIGSFAGKPGIGPMEMLLLGIAGCTGMDIVSILTKKRQKPDKFQVIVRGKRADQHPKVFTEIEVLYELWGGGIETASVEQAIQLSEDKYCSASAMMREVARMRSNFVLHGRAE
jgi:putative redox protein